MRLREWMQEYLLGLVKYLGWKISNYIVSNEALVTIATDPSHLHPAEYIFTRLIIENLESSDPKHRDTLDLITREIVNPAYRSDNYWQGYYP